MATLVNNEPNLMINGKYTAVLDITSGTVSFNIAIKKGYTETYTTAVPLIDASTGAPFSFSASGAVNLGELPDCQLTPVATDAVIDTLGVWL